MSPIDSCPYRRPFAEIFADCPGYEPEIFASTNMRGLPLAPVWTCQNLSVGEVDGQKGHLYPRCVIGDAVARRAALFRKLRGPQAA